MLLRLTDGTTTITLTSTPWLGATYFPAPVAGAQTVMETAVCTIEGTEAAIRSAVQGVEWMLWRAKKRKEMLGPRVFVEWRPGSSGDIYRSEVYGGQVTWSADPARRRMESTTNTGEIAITWTRNYCFEDTTLRELEISASNQSAAISGRTIYNHWDGDTGHGFWFTIAGAQVSGSEPAPLRLELTNNVGAARAYAQLHIANNTRNDPANFVTRIEGESASSGGSNASDATCSNGSKRNLTVNTTTTVTWALNDAFVADTKGARFWLLARVLSLTGAVVVRPELRTSAGDLVWSTKEPVRWITSTPHLAVVCTMPIPPGGWDAPWDDLVLHLVFNSTTSVTLSIDYLAFFPADNYRFVPTMGGSVANNETIILDDIEGWAGVANGGLVRPIISPRNKPLLIYPGVTQRLYVLQHLLNNCNIADTFSVRAFYRPRRLTL